MIAPAQCTCDGLAPDVFPCPVHGTSDTRDKIARLNRAIQAVTAERDALREALTYYAMPRRYGNGVHAIFVDDCGVAKEALDA